MFARTLTQLLIPLLLACVLVQAAHAQCDPQWIPNGPGQEISGGIECMTTFDPDGAGPQPSLFVVGGYNLKVRGLATQKVLAFDGTSWRPLETPSTSTPGTVRCLAVYNGELIIAGEFGNVNGLSVNNIARWNGTTWAALANGVYSAATIGGGRVFALAASNGFLFAGGDFDFAGPNLVANNIARWNGSSWTTIGGVTATSGTVNALVDVVGELYVGGSFSTAGGIAASNLARYSPTTGAWAAMGNPNGSVSALAQFTGIAFGSERLYVGGFFTNIGGVAATGAARYSPSSATWSAIGAPAGRTLCHQLFVRSTGVNSHQVAGVWSGATSPPPLQAFTLSGTTWSVMNGAALDDVQAIGLRNGQYVLGLDIDARPYAVQRWDGSQWAPLGTQGTFGSSIRAMAVDPATGDLYAGTQSSFVNGVESEAYLTRRSAATGLWTRIPGTFGTAANPAPSINAVVVRPGGEVIVGGNYRQLGNYLMRWDGTAWSVLGGGVQGSGVTLAEVHALLKLSNGDLLVGGSFTHAGGILVNGIARWNGATWSPLAQGMQFGGVVYALAELPNGDIIAGGNFNVAGLVVALNVARWNGTSWSDMGGGTNNPVYSLVPAPGGGVYAGGIFSTAGGVSAQGIARWDGSSWQSLAPLTSFAGVSTLLVLPDNSLLIGGQISNFFNHIMRWNGVAFVPMDGGASAPVRSLVSLPTGMVAAGGEFSSVSAGISNAFALINPIGCGLCDSIDFNRDTLTPDSGDLDDFINVLAGGPAACSTFPTPGCNDIDFNNDGFSPDSLDLDSFLSRLAGGPCL